MSEFKRKIEIKESELITGRYEVEMIEDKLKCSLGHFGIEQLEAISQALNTFLHDSMDKESGI